MTKSSQQVKDNLILLEHKIEQLAKNLASLYQEYLPHLVKVIQRQLMVATYQICTQKYPTAFLKLSYAQRTKLQEQIKDLAHKLPPQLSNKWMEKDPSQYPILRELSQTALQNMLLNESMELTEKIESENDQDSTVNNEPQISSSSLTEEEENLSTLPPEELIKLQMELDDCIEQSLIELSNSANQYLQEAQVLSQHIPNQILAIALQAEENTSLVSGAPNLLSVLIEKDKQSEEELDITPVVAICLRINDLEFHDSHLNLIKQKIVRVLNQADNLSDKYNELQNEYNISQAEAAWRASWYEDK